MICFRLFSSLWSGCCRFDTFSISFLNFITKRLKHTLELFAVERELDACVVSDKI